MELAFALLAEAAAVSPNGEVFVLGGGLDSLASSSLPSTMPAMSLVVALRLTPEDCPKEHELRVDIGDPKGKLFMPLGPFKFGPYMPPLNPEKNATHNCALKYTNLQIEYHGVYSFLISVDGRKLGTVVVHSEAPNGG